MLRSKGTVDLNLAFLFSFSDLFADITPCWPDYLKSIRNPNHTERLPHIYQRSWRRRKKAKSCYLCTIAALGPGKAGASLEETAPLIAAVNVDPAQGGIQYRAVYPGTRCHGAGSRSQTVPSKSPRRSDNENFFMYKILNQNAVGVI